MVYKIKLSDRALKDIDQTIIFLLKNWTVKDAKNFLDKFEGFKNIISKNPLLFGYFDKDNLIHKAVLTKHNVVFYQVNEYDKTVQIITIFNVYQNPEKLGLRKEKLKVKS